jgi:hypothetical protein
MHRVDPNSIAACSFLLQGVALLLIVTSLSTFNPWAVVDLGVITTLLPLAGIFWFKFGGRRTATDVMKLQLLLGLYFLI